MLNLSVDDSVRSDARAFLSTVNMIIGTGPDEKEAPAVEGTGASNDAVCRGIATLEIWQRHSALPHSMI